MIRDPSDGSVKEAPADQNRREVAAPPVTPGSDPGIAPASGLPFGSTKPEAQARLEKSREWLKQYREAVDDANRMNDKG